MQIYNAPSIRKLVTPQNECCPIAGTLDSVMRSTRNDFSELNIAPIMMLLRGPWMMSSATFASSIFTGTSFRSPGGKNKACANGVRKLCAYHNGESI